MSYIRELFIISRPRFWLYLAGPCIVAVAFSHKVDLSLNLILLYQLFYFLIPVNIFLYGINDIYDAETDLHNPKKNSMENKVSPHNISIYWLGILVSMIFSFILLYTLSTPARYLFIIFLLLAYWYSAPPFRFKAHPVLDSFSNILYVFPGILIYHNLTGSLPPASVLLAAACWAGAMHLFSAIPDIQYDKAARLQTSATVLRKERSLGICFILWLAAAMILLRYNLYFSFAFIYPLLPVLVYLKKITLTKAYWLFPVLNAVCGFLLFYYGAFLA